VPEVGVERFRFELKEEHPGNSTRHARRRGFEIGMFGIYRQF